MPLRATLRHALLYMAFALPAPALLAQIAPGASASQNRVVSRVMGTVAAVSADSVTVRTEGASAGTVTLPFTPATRVLRATPGATSLRDATPIQPSDLSVGDRVLIRPDAQGAAGVVVAMKGADIAQKREGESAAWQSGVAGIVQGVDPGGETVTLRATGGAPPEVVHRTPATVVRRYAPASTSFADATKGSFADIHPGDQLRARGERAAEVITAEEIIVGSFRNVAGVVLNADPTANTLTLTNLQTKKPETLHLTPATQLRRLPPELASRLAQRGKGQPQQPSGEPADSEHRRGGGASNLLEHAPTTTLANLHKGEAVMVVASGPGASEPTAITVLAGVEPLLTASPEAAAGVFSASWDLGGGEGSEAAPQQ